MKNSRKLYLALMVLVLAIAIFLTFTRHQENPLLQRASEEPAKTLQSMAAPTPLLAPKEMAQIDLDKVHHMITGFHTLMGENPVGTNAEIMKALNGSNPRQARLGPSEGAEFNRNGELLDHWGTPYFFHQLSRDKMEVRSAGPDKIMWTSDDETVR